MEKTIFRQQKNAQKKYRKQQTQKGLVRFEVQVKADTKERFEKLVEVVADEYQEPWDPRRRLALARIEVFDQITKGIMHEFTSLQEEIAQLKKEIAAISPTFFKSTSNTQTPLPTAILTLSDDPAQLKSMLGKLYRDLQIAQQEVQKYKSSSERYQNLYEALSNYNEELLLKLKANGITIQEMN